MEPIRLNKYLSEVGYCSRRKADELVASGLVLVNGKPAHNGMRVTDEDYIEIDHVMLDLKKHKKRTLLLAFNKPRGIVCSSTGQGAKTVEEYLALSYRVFSVGRLDKDSEGLLLLTNDGELANRISRARFYHEKEYVVTVDKPVTEKFLHQLSAGVKLDEGMTRTCRAWKSADRTFHIVLTQGLNRQIRRMCMACGFKVTLLKRIRVLNITLGELKEGQYRRIFGEELCELLKILGLREGGHESE